jgi:hypothetical protein
MFRYSRFVILVLICLLDCQCSEPEETSKEYIIIWKYRIKPEAVQLFEKEYGSEGAWVNLFTQSNHYGGSVLYKSDEEKNSYLLIDYWDSKEEYETFKEKYRAMYDSLGTKFESLYVEEKKIGSFSGFK